MDLNKLAKILTPLALMVDQDRKDTTPNERELIRLVGMIFRLHLDAESFLDGKELVLECIEELQQVIDEYNAMINDPLPLPDEEGLEHEKHIQNIHILIKTPVDENSSHKEEHPYDWNNRMIN